MSSPQRDPAHSFAISGARTFPVASRIGAVCARGTLTLLAVALLAASGCSSTGYAFGSAQAKPIVMGNAERDLDCPVADIRLEEGWGGRWQAIGCGRKASYNAKCDGISCEVAPGSGAVPWRDRPETDPAWRH